MKTRIADRGVERKSERLAGKRIAIGICGGIAAVETVKIIRELRRQGAEVTAFFTPSATDFVGEVSVEWACGRPVVTRLQADVGHLDDFALVLVAPLTWNTMAKAALGLADNPVSMLVASQLGRRSPVALVPTMNLQLRAHPLFDGYRRTLEGWGVRFLENAAEEDRLKIPTPEAIRDFVLETLKA